MWHLNDDGYEERLRKSRQYCMMAADDWIETGRKARWWHLLWLPLKKLLVTYALLRGYRDGVPGLIWALHGATAELRTVALVWDRQNRFDRCAVESLVWNREARDRGLTRGR